MSLLIVSRRIIEYTSIYEPCIISQDGMACVTVMQLSKNPGCHNMMSQDIGDATGGISSLRLKIQRSPNALSLERVPKLNRAKTAISNCKIRYDSIYSIK